MSDIKDWGAFLRGRWNWTKGGYEDCFPRSCQFSDVDAVVEFDGLKLYIETKAYDGLGDLPIVSPGQLRLLRDIAEGPGVTVLLLFGCGPCNDPHVVKRIADTQPDDQFYDWRGLPKAERRLLLKDLIGKAMGV